MQPSRRSGAAAGVSGDSDRGASNRTGPAGPAAGPGSLSCSGVPAAGSGVPDRVLYEDLLEVRTGEVWKQYTGYVRIAGLA